MPWFAGWSKLVNLKLYHYLLPSLMDREDLTTAIALRSIINNTARFIGPALAGMIIVFGNTGLVFAINGFTYSVFVISLLWMRLPKEPRPEASGKSIGGEVLAGARYAAGHPGIAPLLMMLMAIGLLGRPLIELYPGFAALVFSRGADGLAWLTSFNGLGAMVAGLWIARRGHIEGLTAIAITNLAIAGIAVMMFTATSNFPLALACGAVLGFALVVGGVATQTLIQRSAPSQVRGRVMSLYGIVWRGGPAVGALAIGTLSDEIGLRLPVAAGGAVLIFVWYWAVRRRPSMIPALEKAPSP